MMGVSWSIGFNPWKGFRGFEAGCKNPFRQCRYVSIPERVLEALKHRDRAVNRLHQNVSIPERVLEALKPEFHQYGRKGGVVSIPERVLEALKQSAIHSSCSFWCCFNPWKGFRGFEAIVGLATQHIAQVSIPERVLEALKLLFRMVYQWLTSVSIPERVLEALKRSQHLESADCPCSFNPWKGFRGFEAIQEINKAIAVYAFQSLKGF